MHSTTLLSEFRLSSMLTSSTSAYVDWDDENCQDRVSADAARALLELKAVHAWPVLSGNETLLLVTGRPSPNRRHHAQLWPGAGRSNLNIRRSNIASSISSCVTCEARPSTSAQQMYSDTAYLPALAGETAIEADFFGPMFSDEMSIT
jgi:hypothetical protein